MYQSIPQTHSHLRVFGACLLSFMILLAPMASVGAATLRATAPRTTPKAATKKTTASDKLFAALEAALFEPAAAPIVGPITASKVDTFPSHPSSQAEPGDAITYDVNIQNTGTDDATNVQFSDTIDANTTLVPGSLKVSPLAFTDTYTAEKDVALVVGAPGVLTNDTGLPAPTAVPIASGPTTGGGTVTLNADGSFNYTPASGFTGADTFTYTATNGLTPNDTGIVTINVDARPTVSSTTPTNAATNQATSTNITINFSEAVDATTNSFTIECPTPGNLQSFAVSGSGTSAILLNPTADLPAGTTCTVTVIANEISDTDTNDPPDIMSSNFVFSFTTDAAPSVTSTTPTNGATNVATNSNITVNFSESVSLGATPVTISCATSGAHTFVVSASPNTAFTINPNVDFVGGENCTVTVLAAQVTDTDAGDPPDNMAANFVFSFTTDAAPTVTSTTPTNGATNQTTNADITLNFSESVSLGATPVTISCTTSGAHAFVVSAGPNTTFTVNPNVDFVAGETCTVTVLAAQVTDTDAGDPPDNMAANFVFSFSTDAAPTVTATTPTNGATQVANNANVSITFSESVNLGATPVTISCVTSGSHTSVVSASPNTVFTVNPDTDFANGEICTVTVLAAQVTDNDANDPPDNMAVDFVFSFTIDAAPAVTTTVPTNGATDVAQSSTVTINFSETVNVAAGGVTINCGSAVAFTPALPQLNTSSLVLTPTGGLPAGSDCTVTVVAANVTDTDSGDPPDNMVADHVFSFKVKPDAVNDTYPVTLVGNVSTNSFLIPYSVTTNDLSAAIFTISAVQANSTIVTNTITTTSVNGGNIVMTVSGADRGKFTYDPPAGFEGTDTFTYTISRTDGGGTDTATVNMPVSGMVWFINNNAASCLVAGCGRLSNPFSTLAAFNTLNDNGVAAGHPGNNDNIFIYESVTAYTGAVTLLSGQKFIGQDATATLSAITGLTPPSGSPSFPAMNTGAPTTNITSTVTMHNSTTVRGLSINVTGTSSGLVASARTGLVVNDVATISAVSSPGVAASFTSSTGTFTFTNISASGSAAGLNFSSTTSGSTVTGNNINTTSGAAFTTSSTGTTDFTFNDVTSTTGTAVSVTTSTGDFIFHAISANGGAKGISVNSATGTFTVNGTSTTDASGGTIQNATSRGAEFISSNNITLKNMNFTNNGTTQTVAGSASTCGGNLVAGNNLSCVSQLHLQTVATVSLDNLNITSGDQMGINGNAVSAFTLTNSNVTSNGNESFENGLTFQNLSGTCTITDTLIKDNYATQMSVVNIASSSTLTLNVTGTRTNNAYPTMDTSTTEIGKTSVVLTSDQAFLFNTSTTATNLNATINFTGVVFNNAYPGNAVLLNPLAASGTFGGTTTNCSFDRTGGGVIIQAQNGMGGTYNITNSEFYQTDLQSILYAGLNPFNSTLIGTVQGNTIGSAAHAGSACTPGGSNCTGIDVNFIGGTGAIQAKIGGTGGGQGNTVQQFDGNGIRVVANGSSSPSVQVAIQNNTVQNPFNLVAHGIDINIGTTAGANVIGCLNITGNTVTGTYEDPGVGQLALHTRVRFLSEHRLPGMSGTGAANAETFLNTNNPGVGGLTRIFSEGAGVPGYQSGAACTTPLLIAEGGVESALSANPLFAIAFPNLVTSAGRMAPCRAATAQNALLNPAVTNSSLSQQELDTIVSAAIQRWSSSGLNQTQMAAIRELRFEVDDLNAGYLGEADGNRILVDRDAQGKGWFIDATPADDAEFGTTSSATRRYTNPYTAAAGRIDLLTAIEHEIGHKLGLNDSYLEKDRDSIMYGYLTVGERRAPAMGQAANAQTRSLTGTHYLKLEDRQKAEGSKQKAVSRNHAKYSRALTAPASGETVNHTVGTLPGAKTVHIQFQVTVNTPFGGTNQVSNQGTVSGSNFSNVLTDDTDVGANAGETDPTVTPVVAAADAVNDAYTAFKNTPLNVPAPGVLANDGGSPTVTAIGSCLDVTSPFNCTTTPGGTLVVNTDGSFSYTPPSSTFTGPDTFSYTATNGSNSDTATVTITVSDTSAIFINEVLFNPDATGNNEYIELRGGPSSTIPNGTYFVVVDSDAGTRGDVTTIINLSGLTFGTNGFLVLLQEGNTYTTAAGATVITSTTTGFGGLPGGIWSADASATDLENNSAGFMLIQTGVAPTLTDDIDANDNGGIDGTVFPGWAVRDSINVLDAGANASGYGAFGYRNSAGTGGSNGTEVIVTFLVTYVGRQGDSTGSTAADWVASGVLGGAAPNWTLGIATETEPTTFAGKALNHIGTTNFENSPPVNTVPGAQATNEDVPLTFNAGNGNLISIADTDAGGASVQVTLTTTNGVSTLSGITGLNFLCVGCSGDGTNDALMVFQGTITDINAALDGLTFTPTLNFNGVASLQITTDDLGNTGDGGAKTDTDTVNITVNGQNDAPVLDNTGNMSLTAISEDIANASNTGTLVSAIIASAGGDRITDPDAGALEGLAVTAVDNTNGAWQFSIDNGTNWIAFGSPGATTARLLAANATTRVRFIPAANFNGTVNPGITFRAWDQTSGTNGNTANVSINGNATAFSTATETAGITITEVNDAPTATNDTLSNVAEDSGQRTIPFADLTGNDSKGPANESSQTLIVMTVSNPVGGTVSISGSNVLFTPTANYNGPASFQYTVEDNGTTNGVAAPLTSAVATVSFNITAVADTPSVTNAATNVNVQTTSGLVITPNVADGAEVTHFKITAITGGTLFQNNGSTPINNGDFITVAQGAAGLKFTPTLNSTATGHFTVQASLNATDAGLGGGTVTADITVTPLTTISIDDVSIAEGNSGATNYTFNVSLSAASTLTVTVDYATADGMAAAPSDYTALTTNTLTFNPGDVTKTVTVAVNGDTTNEADETFFVNLTTPVNATIADNQGLGTVVNDDTPLIQFNSATYTISEGAINTPEGFASLTVQVDRSGDTSGAATVRYATSDLSGAAECNLLNSGNASQRCDYLMLSGTLRFAAGETTKTFEIPIVNDGYVDGPEQFTINLQNITGATLGAASLTTVTITDDDVTATDSAHNPYLNNSFFVRMHYLDFLEREPDTAGFNDWVSVLNNCNPNQGFLGAPVGCDRAHVSKGFFGATEFIDRGFLVYRLYDVGLARLPDYATEYNPDSAQLRGFGLTALQIQQNLDNYLLELGARTEFVNRYASMAGNNTTEATQLIQLLETTAGVMLPASPAVVIGPPQYGRADLIDKRATGQFTVVQTVKAFVEQKVVYDKEFPGGFVTMQYFNYLRRNPDMAGRADWLNVILNGAPAQGIAPGDYRHLIFGFIYSTEYRQRFGTP